MSIDSSNVISSFSRADWATVQKTIGTNHSTIIGVVASCVQSHTQFHYGDRRGTKFLS